MSNGRPAKWKVDREKKAFRRELAASGRINLARIDRGAQRIAAEEMLGDEEITQLGAAR